MATNGRTWPLKLKERCVAVGWIVTLSKAGHYKVRTKRGRGFSFPSTPGDRRAELNAIAAARRHGLDKLEETLARTGERDRQERIRRDRTSVGAALVSAAVASETETENEEGPMEKEIAQKKGSLGYVDGVAVAERAPAYFKSPAPQMHGKKVQLSDASELLLEDGRVVYRCEKLGSWKDDIPPDQPCHATFESAQSARIHITFHSRKDLPIAPGARKKMARQAGTTTAREAVARVAKATAKKAPAKAAKPAKTSPEDIGVVARMVGLTEKFERLQDELELLGKSAEELSAELQSLARALPDEVADEAIIEKAQKFDELRKVMG